MLVKRENIFRNPVQSGRVKSHEGVRDVVDRVVVDGSEVPLGIFDNLRRGGVCGHRVGDQLRQRVQPLVLALVDFLEFGDKEPKNQTGNLCAVTRSSASRSDHSAG